MNPDRSSDPQSCEGKSDHFPATFGAGCFWCVEAVFERLEGITSVQSGYMGGSTSDPTYEEICGGRTGHAEVIQVRCEKSSVSYERLLEAFWKAHDPTTLNRQGADVGTQYRSVIFYHSEEQREEAENSKDAMDQSGVFDAPIVTEITMASEFYEAEGYHQSYFRNNPAAPYCQFVIAPKMAKLGLV